jgi:F-type H+-transporting ATPase subunit a
VQWEGIRANGVLGHFKHFAGPKLPIFMAIFITPLIFAIEIVSELMKNVSLSLRLFGNIHGGHVAVDEMNKLTTVFPVGMLLLPIKLLTSVIQALIFTLLTCVYLSLVTHHAEDHGPESGHGEAAHAH